MGNEHFRPSQEDLDESHKVIDGIELRSQPHVVVDALIRTSWEDKSPAQNCYSIIILTKTLDMTFDEVITLVNHHVFFQRNSKEAELHRERLLDMKKQSEDLLDAPDYVSVHERFIQESNELENTPPILMEHYYDEMHFKIFADYEEVAFNNFTTTGFKALEKTFHPLTAPNFKKELIDDYMKMQRELKIPFEEEGVHKLFGDSGIKHIWHMYGLLAAQTLTKTDPFWTIDSMGEWHDATKKWGAKSLLDDTEFFVFMSSTRRLMQVKEDHNKIFTLLIFVYEEYANDKDWLTTWDFYYSLEGFPDELKPSKFADRMMQVKSYVGSKGFTIRNRNYDWNIIYCAKEYLATKGLTSFDNYIEEKYFLKAS